MKFISHRGNLYGPSVQNENSPNYIDDALKHFECEVDLWVLGNDFFLGHDMPQHKVDYRWLDDRAHSLWIHCKNVYALELCQSTFWHYFFHNNDFYTLTSKRIPWGYPTATPIRNAVIAVPETHYGRHGVVGGLLRGSLIEGICTDYPMEYQGSLIEGICTDYPMEYQKLLNSP